MSLAAMLPRARSPGSGSDRSHQIARTSGPLSSSPPRTRATASSEYGRRSCLHATYPPSLPPQTSELAGSLLSPGWYANWNSDTEATVVFPGKIFRYPHGDQAGREEAKAHGRSVGVPEPQLDWTD
jgi:hypothetical protein